MDNRVATVDYPSMTLFCSQFWLTIGWENMPVTYLRNPGRKCIPCSRTEQCLIWLLLSEVQYSQMDWRGWIWVGKQQWLACRQVQPLFSWGIQCSGKNFSAFYFVLYKRTSPGHVQFVDPVGDPALQQVCFVQTLERESSSCEKVAIPSYLRSAEYSMNPSLH